MKFEKTAEALSRLSAEQHRVTQENGTERAFTGEYDKHFKRWHQTLKNRILLDNYYLPSDLRQQIDAFVDHNNHQRYHESL